MKLTAYIETAKKAGVKPKLEDAYRLGCSLYHTTSPDGDKGELLYDIAEAIANRFLKSIGVSWDDLPDVNSLWDALESADKDDMYPFKQAVQQLCIIRVSEVTG
jgi:hypothetical protein